MYALKWLIGADKKNAQWIIHTLLENARQRESKAATRGTYVDSKLVYTQIPIFHSQHRKTNVVAANFMFLLPLLLFSFSGDWINILKFSFFFCSFSPVRWMCSMLLFINSESVAATFFVSKRKVFCTRQQKFKSILQRRKKHCTKIDIPCSLSTNLFSCSNSGAHTEQ